MDAVFDEPEAILPVNTVLPISRTKPEKKSIEPVKHKPVAKTFSRFNIKSVPDAGTKSEKESLASTISISSDFEGFSTKFFPESETKSDGEIPLSKVSVSSVSGRFSKTPVLDLLSKTEGESIKNTISISSDFESISTKSVPNPINEQNKINLETVSISSDFESFLTAAEDDTIQINAIIHKQEIQHVTIKSEIIPENPVPKRKYFKI